MTAEQDRNRDAILDMDRGQDVRQGLRLAFYFRHNRIYIGKKTMEVLGMPDYVHLFISFLPIVFLPLCFLGGSGGTGRSLSATSMILSYSLLK